MLRMTGIALVVYLGLLAIGAVGFMKVTQGFVPRRTRTYVIASRRFPTPPRWTAPMR